MSLTALLGRRAALRAIVTGVPALAMLTGGQRVIANADGSSTEPEAASQALLKFSGFDDWFSKFGHAHLKTEARYINGFDGDLLDAHYPWATKVRIQRRRNYERLLDARRGWFARTLGLHGFVSWWA